MKRRDWDGVDTLLAWLMMVGGIFAAVGFGFFLYYTQFATPNIQRSAVAVGAISIVMGIGGGCLIGVARLGHWIRSDE